MVQTGVSEKVESPELQLPRGSTVARLALLGFFLLSAAGALLRIHQAVTRVSDGRLLQFLWSFASLQIGMATVDAVALFWVERRRAAGYYLGAGAVAIHIALIHYGSVYHPTVLPANHTEAVGANATIWAVTLTLIWLISVLVRGGRVASQKSRRPERPHNEMHLTAGHPDGLQPGRR